MSLLYLHNQRIFIPTKTQAVVMKLKKPISPIAVYRLVRWGFAAFFLLTGFLYEDAWAAFIFAGIFLITSFLKPYRCLGNDCDLETHKNN